jgi:hypothetical protein
VSDDDPRWRSPEASHGLETGFENGSAAEELRADAHDCIMVRSLRTYRIQGCGAMIRARWQSSPLIIVPTTTSVCRRARPCQGAAWKRRTVRPGQSDGRP